MTQVALFQLLPELAPDEYDELRDDIRANGVRVPVDVDEHGHILDGHHRVRIAGELGLGYETRVLSGLTDEQKRAHALAVNVHRRQLNREQKRELIRRSLSADPQLSDRQHAERTGTDHKTVGAQRADLAGRGEIPHVSHRTDSTGRQQPAERQAAEIVEIEGSQPLPVEFPAGNEWGAAFAEGIDAVESAQPEELERARPPKWDPEERRQHETEALRVRDIADAQQQAKTLVPDVRALIFTVLQGSRQGAKGLVTRDMVADIRRAVDLLEGEINDEE